ncbi:MAG: hypothetical protein LBQ19_00480 [Synergistaceae bacterium]|jgi:hypothetical protein|nr:hypothetical protein [Synergistaceae bacterium]
MRSYFLLSLDLDRLNSEYGTDIWIASEKQSGTKITEEMSLGEELEREIGRRREYGTIELSVFGKGGDAMKPARAAITVVVKGDADNSRARFRA